MNNPSLLDVYSPRLATLRSSMRASGGGGEDKYVDKSDMRRPSSKSSDKSNLPRGDQIFGRPGEEDKAGLFLRGGGRRTVGEFWRRERENQDWKVDKDKERRRSRKREEVNIMDKGGMSRGRETRSSLREGIWNWGRAGKEEERSKLRRFSLSEGLERERGVRLRMTSASEVEFCLANHQKEDRGLGQKIRKKENQSEKIKPHNTWEDDVCDCGEDDRRGQKERGRSNKSRRQKERHKDQITPRRDAASKGSDCDKGAKYGRDHNYKERYEDRGNRVVHRKYLEEEDDLSDDCNCSDSDREGERRCVADDCECEFEEEDKSKSEKLLLGESDCSDVCDCCNDEVQSEAYRSLPEVHEDVAGRKNFGEIMRDKNKRRSKRGKEETVRAEKQKVETSFNERSVVSIKRKSREKGVKYMEAPIENERSEPRKEKKVETEKLKKEEVTLGQLQDGRGKIRPGGGAIRHFERSDHLCRDVQTLRK